VAELVAGVDEAGRGPIAGPVVAAAVVLGYADIPGLADSKKLTERRRDALASDIRERCVTYGVARATVAEIEKLNILGATFLAMRRALALLSPRPCLVVVDGPHPIPRLRARQLAVVDADESFAPASAASILAKVERDRMMRELAEQYPQYGFQRHKGYCTEEHLAALREHGPCPAHRMSFAPVRAVLSSPEDLQRFIEESFGVP